MFFNMIISWCLGACATCLVATKQSRDKFKAIFDLPCAFFGYLFGKKGYKFVSLKDKKFYTPRDIVLYKIMFHFSYQVIMLDIFPNHICESIYGDVIDGQILCTSSLSNLPFI